MVRGELARNKRQRRLRQRNAQDLSDIQTNTRKRRRIARRLAKDEPLFAYGKLLSLIPWYTEKMFLRDARPTKTTKTHKSFPFNPARMEMHYEVLEKMKSEKTNSNRFVTKLMLNWENINKPFTLHRFGFVFRFPKRFNLKSVQRAASDMMKLESVEELNAYFDKLTSYGS